MWSHVVLFTELAGGSSPVIMILIVDCQNTKESCSLVLFSELVHMLFAVSMHINLTVAVKLLG